MLLRRLSGVSFYFTAVITQDVRPSVSENKILRGSPFVCLAKEVSSLHCYWATFSFFCSPPFFSIVISLLSPFFTILKSIPDGVVAIFHSYNPSGRTMALELTEPLTEMSEKLNQSHYRPGVAQRIPVCCFPDFMTTAQEGGKVVSLKHRPHLPPGNPPGTHFC